MLPYYKKCHDAVHALIPAATIVLNPGTTCAEGYMNVSNIICTWETEEPDYLNKFQAPAWAAKYPAGRFWHIVLDVPASDLPKVLALTKKSARRLGVCDVADREEQRQSLRQAA